MSKGTKENDSGVRYSSIVIKYVCNKMCAICVLLPFYLYPARRGGFRGGKNQQNAQAGRGYGGYGNDWMGGGYGGYPPYGYDMYGYPSYGPPGGYGGAGYGRGQNRYQPY